MNLKKQTSFLIMLLFLAWSGVYANVEVGDSNPSSKTGAVSELFMQGQQTVTGVVTDNDGFPLPGVTVVVQGTTIGSITDIDGRYNLSVSEGDMLNFSFIGFVTETVAVGGRTTIDIMLIPDILEMEEVVVTALGIKRDTKALGYAMSEVKGEELASVNTVNVMQALQGKSAGLSVGLSDGSVFGNTKIQLRGVSVMNQDNNNPIFVIDGVILDNSISNASADWDASSNDFGNMIKNLNPDDFESVSVLKGAAATALYGSRGINGAIVISTKTGEGQKGIGVRVTQSLGIDHVYRQPDIQYEFGPGALAGYTSYGEQDGSGSYYRFSTNQMYLNTEGVPTKRNHPWDWSGYGPRYDGRPMVDYDGEMTTYSPVKDHFKEVFDLGVNTNTSVAITGGSDKGSFYLSNSYNKRKGVLPNNEFTRNATQLSSTYELTSWLRADASVSFSTSVSENPRNDIGENFLSGNIPTWYDTKKWNQRDVYQAPHGGTPSADYGDEFAFVPMTGLWFNYNLNENVRNEYVTRPVVRLTADLADWISVTAEGNMNYFTANNENKELGQGYANEGGYYSLGHEKDVSRTGKLVFNLKKDLNEDLSTGLILGGEMWDQTRSNSRVWTNGGLVVPGQYFVENSKETRGSEAKMSGTKQINSLYFMANVGWKSQVFMDVTGRNDWSSALVYTNGTGNFSYFYPSVSASWIFTESLELPYWFTFGKFRASWAQVGNDTAPYFINRGYALSTYELANGFAYGNAMADSSVDPEIKPERKNSIELGLDARLFNGRVNFDFAWYDETIEDQIGQVPLPEESGLNGGLITNVGSLVNTGIEISLGVTPIKNRNFDWTSTFNYWENETTVENLHESYGEYRKLDGDADYGNFRIASVAYNGGEYGILMSDSKPKVWQSEDPNDPRNGMKVLAYSGNARAAYYARSMEIEPIGKLQPDFEGSWSNDFRYKNLTLSVLLDARYGGHMASYSNRYGTAYGWLDTSLDGREGHGGVTWTSEYADRAGQTFHDGVIPEGVFAEGTTVATPGGASVNVGGMTFQEALDAGYVEPSHASGHNYFSNSWGQGTVNDDWFSEVKYIALRNISLGYNLPRNIAQQIRAQNVHLSVNARNLAYLYNSLPNNLHPESFRGTASSTGYRERSFTPYTATYTFSVSVDF
jgi:iron complex outermembrane receptor protein